MNHYSITLTTTFDVVIGISGYVIAVTDSCVVILDRWVVGSLSSSKLSNAVITLDVSVALKGI